MSRRPTNICPADPAHITQAAELLRAGKLVAIPTETVYGLAADARNDAAVSAIFEAKKRPTGHPMIVHIADVSAMEQWGQDVSTTARQLAAHFWPGPLTMIVKRAPGVSDVVTGGLQTVGLRVPAHPVALAVLGQFGGGVAAPSANKHCAVSPTSAAHVQNDLGEEVAMILDGGPCRVGVESTIVDVSEPDDQVHVLRAGGVTIEAIEDAMGRKVLIGPRKQSKVRAPGTMALHYAPMAQVVLCAPEAIAHTARALVRDGARIAVLSDDPSAFDSKVLALPFPQDASAAAALLFDQLRAADKAGCTHILAVLPDETGMGRAVADRLRRAAGPRS